MFSVGRSCVVETICHLQECVETFELYENRQIMTTHICQQFTIWGLIIFLIFFVSR